MNAFLPADILLPKTDHMEKWAVIACDQFTSDQAYWDRVRKNAEGAVSTINLILPEAERRCHLQVLDIIFGKESRRRSIRMDLLDCSGEDLRWQRSERLRL